MRSVLIYHDISGINVTFDVYGKPRRYHNVTKTSILRLNNLIWELAYNDKAKMNPVLTCDVGWTTVIK